ncbi:type VII secretion integral membrane protein EccD [Streptomyces sp. RKCA744]|uniref:type VII secretion integral membrane protein EccD n=1 Tax=Streptomyces sp. RKCA744 TaxID=2959340 RepID=UPI00209EABFE|nr:type VII secretion integral membrane protein EccD [Streptomyces sp. RKCA744]MCO8304498.1 type VII secretion integral membrane protein EccD [Streptomyces sp. RKCA744]
MVAAGTTSGTELSRVTLVGERRRIDLVLPSQEPIGRLLPEILRLLDDQVAARPSSRHLVTASGSALAQDSTLRSAGVPDGAVLRLVHVEDAPSAPVVHDVSDEVAEDLGLRAWRWRPAARRASAGVAMLVWVLTAGLVARDEFASSSVMSVLLLGALVLAVAGAVAGRAAHRGVATALIVAAGALGVLGAWTLADAQAWSGAARLAGTAGAGAVALLLLGWVSPLGRGGLIGAGAVAVMAVGWEIVIALQGGGVEQARVGAVLAVVSVVVLSVVPRLAMMASGLSALDDRRSGGTSVSRHEVATALTATHRGLALATLVVSVSAGAAGFLALRSPTVWTVLLTVVVAVVVALRARAFPLTVEVVGVLLASVVVVLRLIVVWLERSSAYGPLAVLVALAVISLGALAVQPAEHVRVRLRRAGDLAESAGVCALLPLLIGVFGVYERLLDTFA